VVRAAGDGIEIVRQGAVDVSTGGKSTLVSRPSDCPFCRSNGKLSGTVLFASEGAYLIEAQSHPGYYLIIPELHVQSPAKLPDTWWEEMKEVLGHIPGLKREYNISVNVGKLAGQTVHHLHFWVMPRVAGKPSSGKGLASLIEEFR
jgi:diadenosine tetraphosphate (Ap4A) HIT family hydrolase